MVDGLADVVQKPAALRHRYVDAQLCRHDAGKLRDFNRMIEHILPVARTIFQTSQELHKLGVQAVYARIERCLFSGFLDALVDFAFRFVHHFLDTRGVNAPVRDQLFESDTRDLAAYRIETGQNDSLRRVVDNEVDARQRFQRADIAAFAADNPAFHFIVRQSDDGNRRLRDLIGGAALDCLRHDVACPLVCFVFCLLLVLLDH